jgi:hypothetical protein
MPDDSPHDRKMQHLLTKLIHFVVLDGDAYVNTSFSCGASTRFRNMASLTGLRDHNH